MTREGNQNRHIRPRPTVRESPFGPGPERIRATPTVITHTTTQVLMHTLTPSFLFFVGYSPLHLLAISRKQAFSHSYEVE